MSITLSSHDAFDTALEVAHRISISSYSITREMADELERRADLHVEVHVQLTAHPFGNNADKRSRAAARMVEELRQHGVDASLCGSAGAGPHAKAAVIDDVLWLDDRNFPRGGPDLIVRDDDQSDVSAATAVMHGTQAHSDRLTFTKREALRQEADAIRSAPKGEIDVASEVIGTGGVEVALRERLAAGDHVRLLVDAAECTSSSARAALAILGDAGADIRSETAVDKLMVSAGRAWLGSANATFPDPRTAGQSDWGLVTANGAAVADLKERFDVEWSSATPWNHLGARGAAAAQCALTPLAFA